MKLLEETTILVNQNGIHQVKTVSLRGKIILLTIGAILTFAVSFGFNSWAMSSFLGDRVEGVAQVTGTPFNCLGSSCSVPVSITPEDGTEGAVNTDMLISLKSDWGEPFPVWQTSKKWVTSYPEMNFGIVAVVALCMAFWNTQIFFVMGSNLSLLGQKFNSVKEPELGYLPSTLRGWTKGYFLCSLIFGLPFVLCAAYTFMGSTW